MKITLTPTAEIVDINGVPCRQWEGQTDTGVPVTCFITRVAVPEDAGREAHRQFEKELRETPAPHASVSFPLRMVL